MLEPCGAAGNNLRVIYNQLAENETKKDFAVCVKGLDTFGIDHLFCIDCHMFTPNSQNILFNINININT